MRSKSNFTSKFTFEAHEKASIEVEVTLCLAQVVFVVGEEFWPDPHVSELRNQKAEPFARKVELTATLTCLLEKH